MRKLFFVFSAFAALFLISPSRLAASSSAGDEARAIALKDAKVFISPGKVLEKGTVILRGGVIEAVGENVTIPFDAQIIDAKDLLLYAGFIDAHNHLGVAAPAKPDDPEGHVDFRKAAHPETVETNRKGLWAEFKADEFFVLDEKAGEELRKQGFTTFLAAPKEGYIAGRSALASLSGAARRETLIRPAVAMHASFQANGDGYPSALMGVIAHLRQIFFDTSHYSRDWAWYEANVIGVKRPPLDPALEALSPAVSGRLPIIFEVNRENDLNRAITLCEEFHLRPILSGAQEAWKLAGPLAAKHLSVIVGLDFGKEPKKPEEKKDGDSQEPTRIYEDKLKKWEEKVGNAASLDKAGVLFAFTTKGSKNPEEFMTNLRKAIEKGLSKDAALAALTTNPAKIFGLEKSLGSIEVGKAANLVAFTQEFSAKEAKLRYLFVDGKKFEFDIDAKKDKKEDKKEEKKEEAKEEKKGEPTAEKKSEPASKVATNERPIELESDRVPATHTGGNALICNGTVLTVTHGKLENADILVRDGKIAQLGQHLQAPAGFAVIDATGKFITPGLIDCHSHMAIDGGVNEGTLSITAECRIGDVIDPNNVALYRALAGGITAAHLLHGSANVIGGQDATIKLKYRRPVSELRIPDAAQGIKFALGENPKQSNWGNRGSRFPNTRMGVESVLHHAFIEARAYREGWEKFWDEQKKGGNPREPRFDLRLEALAEILSGDIWVHSHCYREDEILMLMRIAEEYGWRVKTFQHVLEGYKVALEMAKHGVAGSTFSDWWAYKIEAYDAIPYNGALMKEAGVNVSFNSDSDEMVRRMYLEAAKAVKYGGLSEEEALAFVTINPAIQLGMDHRTGSIDIGKDADLAIFDAHPFSVYTRCAMTLIEGEVYFERKDLWKDWLPAEKKPLPLEASVNKKTAKPDTDSNLPVKVIFGGTIYPITSEPIANGMVIIRGNRIEAVGVNLPVPEHAETFEATGLRIYPGMIDSGTQLGLTEIGSVHGTNDIAEIGDDQPDLRVSTAINPHSEHIPVTRVNGITTVLTRPKGATVSGQSALIHLDGWVPSEMILKDTVAMHLQFPYVPTMEGDAEEAKKQDEESEKQIKKLKGLFEQAKEYGRAWNESKQQAAANFSRDLRLEALAPYARAEKPVVIEANAERQIRKAIKFGEELGLKVIFSGGEQAWRVADLLAEKKIPVIVGPVLDLPNDNYDPYDSVFHNAAVLFKSGVPFAFQTQESSNVRNLPYHAGMAAAFGLPADEALKAVTIYPAQIFGIDNEVGSIEPGKFADLIVTDGDPLEVRTHVKKLFIAGKDISLETRHTKLYEKFRKRLQENKFR